MAAMPSTSAGTKKRSRAGGILGRDGAVVLDSIHDPSRVIGVADGQGRIKRTHSPTGAAAVAFVEKLIIGEAPRVPDMASRTRP